MSEIEILFGNEKLILNNQRALYWSKYKALIVSDIHLGKSGHFRNHGIAIPNLINQNDVKRLKNLIDHYNTNLLIIVGDLVHAGANSDFDIFKKTIGSYSDLKVILIKGNHDRVKHEILHDLGISEIVNTGSLGPFIFSHDEYFIENHFTISGHIHPGYMLELPIRKKLKLPAFIVTENSIILPAFSEFTGLDTVNHPLEATYYVFTDSEIFKI